MNVNNVNGTKVQNVEWVIIHVTQGQKIVRMTCETKKK